MNTPVSDAAITELWPQYVEAVRARLEAGRKNYGDESFRKSPAILIDEIMQECVDIVGWNFVLWCRLKGLFERVAIHGTWGPRMEAD